MSIKITREEYCHSTNLYEYEFTLDEINEQILSKCQGTVHLFKDEQSLLDVIEGNSERCRETVMYSFSPKYSPYRETFLADVVNNYINEWAWDGFVEEINNETDDYTDSVQIIEDCYSSPKIQDTIFPQNR